MGKKLHHKTRTAVEKKLLAGDTYETIAKQYKISVGVVSNVAKELNIPQIKQITKEIKEETVQEMHEQYKTVSKSQLRQIVEMQMQGLTNAQGKAIKMLQNPKMKYETFASPAQYALTIEATSRAMGNNIKHAKMLNMDGMQDVQPFDKPLDVNVNNTVNVAMVEYV